MQVHFHGAHERGTPAYDLDILGFFGAPRTWQTSHNALGTTSRPSSKALAKAKARTRHEGNRKQGA